LGFTAYQLSNVVYSEATPYVGSVEGKKKIGFELKKQNILKQEKKDPATKLSFPIYLYTDSEWKRLVGLGVRAVSFLKMNVYVVGMYMRSEDIGELRKLKDWKVKLDIEILRHATKKNAYRILINPSFWKTQH
jgi:hypothetical protein